MTTDETILCMTFGLCLIAGAAFMFCAQAAHEWKYSEQKAKQEYEKFKGYMRQLEIEAESEREVIRQIKSINELIKINDRLKRATQAV